MRVFNRQNKSDCASGRQSRSPQRRNKELQKNSITWNMNSPTILQRILLGVCLFFAIGVSSAYAEVIYSAPPDGTLSSGWVSSTIPNYQHDVQDFSLGSDATVTTITVYGRSGTFGSNAPQAFVLEFFADTAGTPEAASFYSTTTAAIAGVDTGVNWGLWDIYKYTFDVPAQLLLAGTTYWFGAKSTDTTYWIWSHSTTDGSGDLWFRTVDGAPWSQSTGVNVGARDNQAFELEGELEGGIIYTCIDPFDQPFDAPLTLKAKKNGAIPVKMQLFDVDGFVVIDEDLAALPVLNVSFAPSNGDPAEDVTGALLPVGQANDDNIFRYDFDEDKFIYNLSTKPYKAPGDYTVTAVSGDSSYEIEGCSQTFSRQ